MTDEGKHGPDDDPKPGEGKPGEGKDGEERGWRDRVRVAQAEGFAYVPGR